MQKKKLSGWFQIVFLIITILAIGLIYAMYYLAIKSGFSWLTYIFGVDADVLARIFSVLVKIALIVVAAIVVLTIIYIVNMFLKKTRDEEKKL